MTKGPWRRDERASHRLIWPFRKGPAASSFQIPASRLFLMGTAHSISFKDSLFGYCSALSRICASIHNGTMETFLLI